MYVPSSYHSENAQREQCYTAKPFLLFSIQVLFQKYPGSLWWGGGKWQWKHLGGEGEHNESIQTIQIFVGCINLFCRKENNILSEILVVKPSSSWISVINECVHAALYLLHNAFLWRNNNVFTFYSLSFNNLKTIPRDGVVTFCKHKGIQHHSPPLGAQWHFNAK